MTVSTTTTKNSAAGNGSTTAFTYSFVITAASELKVYIRTDSTGAEALKTDGTHYNVAGVGAASGGTVTFTSGNIPASGETVVLLRDTPLTQATDYVENDPFPAAAHEDALDKLTHQVQELQEEVDRSLKASKTVTDLTTPEFKDSAAVRADKFLAFDGDGDELTVTDGPLADTSITSVADAHVLLYDGTDARWENKAVSGDIAITSAGVTSIASGVIVNADINASAAIADSKLATISTADKVSGAAVQVDGATDGTSITIADTDKFLIDDGGTTKYVNASQVNSYTSASVAADDIATGDAAASFQTSSGAVVVDSQASTTTIDGHTGVTVQSSNSGDILLDSAADVVLDAAGNDITLKAAGTTFGALTNSSSDLVIESKVADKDILFKGTDDSSAVTALSLDMSEGGKATFAGDVVVTGDLTISGDDLVMGTNTSGAALIGDGTNYNPVVVSGDISIGTDGTAAIGSGVIVNADINGSAAIADSKLDTISTANKVGLAALDIDGGTELGEAIVDADLFIIDNGAGGTNRKVLASRLKTYAGGSFDPDGAVVFNESGADVDFRIESNTNTNAFDLDGGLHGGVGAVGIGRNAENTVDVLIGAPAITADANQSHYRLRLVPAGAVTIPSGTAPQVATLSVFEPNITATGTVTTAASVWIHSAPTEASNNYALFVDDGVSRFDGNVEQSTGINFIGDTANGSMTSGLTINQSTADNETLALKSSDIAHGMTDDTETDTFLFIKKSSGTAGAPDVVGLGESTQGIRILGQCTTANTAKSTSASAPIIFRGVKKSSAGNAVMGSDENVVVIEGCTAGPGFIFDAEGSMHSNAANAVYDEFEDAELVRAVDRSLSSKGLIASKFDEFIRYGHEDLATAGLVGRDDDGSPNNFVNWMSLSKLHNGAIWQQHEKHENLLQAVHELAAATIGEEKACEILDKHGVKSMSGRLLN